VVSNRRLANEMLRRRHQVINFVGDRITGASGGPIFGSTLGGRKRRKLAWPDRRYCLPPQARRVRATVLSVAARISNARRHPLKAKSERRTASAGSGASVMLNVSSPLARRAERRQRSLEPRR